MITAGASQDRVPTSQDFLSQTQDASVDTLFQKVIFYLNPFLGAEKVAKLESSLCRHGAVMTTSSVDTRGASITTHIITDDLDFPDYKHAKARGIDIVKPEWVYRSIALNSLQDPSRFSADPYYIFSGVVLTTTGLPAYDRKLVREAVEKFGGSYVNGVTEDLTHLIALAATGDKYDYVMDNPELKIKVVLPTWFQLCCNMGCLFPENVYEFPDPPMQNPSFDPSQLEVASLGAPQLYSNSVKSVAAFLNSPSQGHGMFLDGLRIVLGEDLTMLPDLRTKFVEKIEYAGGIVLNNAGDFSKEDVDVVICRFRSGPLYTKASKDGKIVATADWLLHVLQTGAISSPKASLLHYPIPNEPIAGMSSLIITVSNYTGSIREYLKRLVQATGATYKPNLTSQASPDPTTHIICGNASGDKYEKGQEWNVKIVNHLWIEDCFQRWSMQSETQHRYTMFPPFNQLSLVFGSKISPESAEDWYLSAEDDEDITLVKHEEVEGVVKDIIKQDDPSLKRSQSPIPKVEASSKLTDVQPTSKSGPPIDRSSPPPTLTVSKHTVLQTRAKTSPVPNTRTPLSPPTLPSGTIASPSSTPIGPLAASTSDTFASPPPTAMSSPMKSKPKRAKETSPESIPTPGESPAPRSRMRGAAMAAATALKNLVPDMNNFQEELQNEKKASKKKKKTAIVDDAVEEDASDMEVDAESSKTTAASSSPPKRKRVSVAGEGRSSPIESDDDDNSTANSSRDEITLISKGPAKKVRRTTKAEKEKEVAAPVEAMETASSTQSGKKDAKQAIRYITTGLPKEPAAKQLKVLKSLGISPTTSIDRSTHLVAKGISRTEKFLVAVAQGKVIVHEDWLQACIDANSVLDENEYRIQDVENEEKFGMDLSQSLKIAREKRVFEDHVFYISPSVVPKPAALKTLVEAGGGRTSALLHTGLNFLKETIQKQKEREAQSESESRGSKGRGQSKAKGAKKSDGADHDEDNGEGEDEDEDKETIAVISCEDDREMWGPILEAKAHVYSHELIIQSILRQSVDLGATHALA
ncbi:hypothetical protein EMPS_06387 [Entomortierella parvispora]|uniref:BRCT domain-containing protein n=1 Tax=Entomortierella parvispora TaxID=205924 RepID=A0A9P3HC67_9FUNG|nr:hypothetical protein EMPS_06387 [Entomortierella parvispora]